VATSAAAERRTTPHSAARAVHRVICYIEQAVARQRAQWRAVSLHTSHQRWRKRLDQFRRINRTQYRGAAARAYRIRANALKHGTRRRTHLLRGALCCAAGAATLALRGQQRIGRGGALICDVRCALSTTERRWGRRAASARELAIGGENSALHFFFYRCWHGISTLMVCAWRAAVQRATYSGIVTAPRNSRACCTAYPRSTRAGAYVLRPHAHACACLRSSRRRRCATRQGTITCWLRCQHALAISISAGRAVRMYKAVLKTSARGHGHLVLLRFHAPAPAYQQQRKTVAIITGWDCMRIITPPYNHRGLV